MRSAMELRNSRVSRNLCLPTDFCGVNVETLFSYCAVLVEQYNPRENGVMSRFVSHQAETGCR